MFDRQQSAAGQSCKFDPGCATTASHISLVASPAMHVVHRECLSTYPHSRGGQRIEGSNQQLGSHGYGEEGDRLWSSATGVIRTGETGRPMGIFFLDRPCGD
jgi:hypothetical protein